MPAKTDRKRPIPPFFGQFWIVGTRPRLDYCATRILDGNILITYHNFHPFGGEWVGWELAGRIPARFSLIGYINHFQREFNARPRMSTPIHQGGMEIIRMLTIPDGRSSSIWWSQGGRWERTNVVNTPLGIVVANEVEFFSDGTGRLRLDDFMRGHSEAFTWSSGSGRIRMEFSDSFIFSSQIHDYELPGSDLTFIYDRATNFHAVFRRAR